MNFDFTSASQYLSELYDFRDEDLKALETLARIENVPIIERESLELLLLLIKIHKPKRILEIGTAIGYSSIAMSKAFDGEIDTIDRSEKWLEIAKSNLAERNLDGRIHIHYGDAREVLDNIDQTYDLIFIDGGKSHYRAFFDLAFPKLESGGLVFSDNLFLGGFVYDDSLVPRRDRTMTRAMRKYLEFLKTDKRLDTSILDLGDGIGISRKV